MMLHAMHVAEINQVVVHCSSALEWLNPPELSLNIRDRTDNSQRVSIIEDIPCKGLFTQNAPWSAAHTRTVNVVVVFNDFDYNDMRIRASERPGPGEPEQIWVTSKMGFGLSWQPATLFVK